MAATTAMSIELADDEATVAEARRYYARIRANGGGLKRRPASVADMRIRWTEIATARTGGVIYTSPAGRDLVVDGPSNPVRVRIVKADPPVGVFLHMHSGGWTVGNPSLEDKRLEWIATATGLSVVSVDYRLAPEHPYPAAVHDCEQVALWLLRHGERELGSGRIVVGGESAGANLALATLLRLRSHPKRAAVLGASLLYGNYDLCGTPAQQRGSTMLSHDVLEWFYDQYVPAGDRDKPEVSPVRADLTGLPPTLLTVGGDDLLVDDSRELFERMREAGVDCRLHVVAGADHGFDSAPLAGAGRARARIADFLRDLTKAGS